LHLRPRPRPQALKDTGIPIRDERNGVTLPFINIEAAVALVQGAPLPRDAAPPAGGAALALNGGQAARALEVPVAVAGAADEGAAGLWTMCLSDDPAATEGAKCKGWMEYSATSARWNLTAGPDGNRTVRLFLADWAGNVRAPPAATAIVEVRREAELTINGGAPYTATRWVEVNVSAPFATEQTRVCFAQGDGVKSARGCRGWGKLKTPRRLRLRGGRQGAKTVQMFLKGQAPQAQKDSAKASIILDTKAPAADTAFWSGFAAAPGGAQGALSVRFVQSAQDGPGGSGVASYAVVISPKARGGGSGGLGAPAAAQACAVRARAGLARAAALTNDTAAVVSAAVAPKGAPISGWLVVAVPAAGQPASTTPQEVTHTFDGLEPGAEYTVRLCVADAAGNVAKGRPLNAAAAA
jgi:hypothetical protein